MPTPVAMPKLGNTVEECLLARWLKSKGDAVSEGEIIAEIETDKANFEVPAPVAGTILEQFFPAGELVPVFANMCVIGNAGEDVEAFRPTAEARVETAAAPVTVAATPEARTESSEAVFLAPRARRFAREHQFDGRPAHGSGPGGRILEQDVRELYLTTSRLRKPVEVEEAVPLSSVRDKIARRLREALAASAQYTLNSSADATALLALRVRLKQRQSPVTINDLVLFATVKALQRIPALNASLRDGKLYPHASVNLGFACDTDRGLLVPVIRDAHTLTVEALAERAKTLAERAVAGSISPDDLTGATFTVSNLGSLGIESFTPILMPPQVALLGVDAITLRPVRRDGRVEFTDRIGLSLTCDHQVIDGAPGARFLKVVAECLENLESLCTI